MDDALVAPKNHLKIGKSNLRLSSNLKSKEPTIQVVLDALKLTPFYNAFEISTDVPEIYIQEFWVTLTRHHSSLPFAAIINKCLSGKITALESLRLSRAQILLGHDTQEYGAILPQHLTNQAMLDSEAFKTYRAYAIGKKSPKSKATNKKTDSESSPKTKPSQASKGKRIKTSAKGDKHATTKSKGLTVLSKVALSEAEQMKSGTNEGAGDKPKVPDVPEYRSESEEESWTFRDEFVHPTLSTYKADEEEEEKEKDDDEVILIRKSSTPPDITLTEEDENHR
ncbi:hypothetical protein Tco_0617543 [Tanacetum coccineum]